jgi:hypothetical protein
MKKWTLALLILAMPLAAQAEERRGLQEVVVIVEKNVSSAVLTAMSVCILDRRIAGKKVGLHLFERQLGFKLMDAGLVDEEIFDFMFLKNALTAQKLSTIASQNKDAYTEKEFLASLTEKYECDKLEVSLSLKE